MYILSYIIPYKDLDIAMEKLQIHNIYNAFYEAPLEITTDDYGYGYIEKDDEDITLKVAMDDTEGELNEFIELVDSILGVKHIGLEENTNDYTTFEFPAIHIDDTWVIASPEEEYPNKNKINFISQGAFGTGLHETTQDILRLILNKLELNDKTVLDIGTGSGILSIAASFTGAKKVDAVDIRDITDEVELNASLNNINNIKAIVGNILHSLEKSEDARRYGAAITELYEQNELKSVLNKMINKFSYYTTVKAVNKCFKSAPLYSTIHNIQEPSYVSLINTEEANQATKNALGIKDLDEMQTSLSKRHLDELKNYLLELELFLEIPSYISLNSGERSEDLEIFMQPGMIYAHSTALIKNLADDSMWKDTCGIADRNLFILRADHFVKGILLENIILAETYKTFQKIDLDRYYVSQLSITLRNNNQHVEADMILVDKQKGESYLFEVKYSNQIVIDQTKHLRNTDFLEYIDENFGKVKSRLVLYTGASSKQNDVLYLNAATYLKRLSIVSNTPRPEIKQLLNENCNTSKPNLKTTSRKKPRKL